MYITHDDIIDKIKLDLLTNEMRVSFTKKDGTVRDMRCTLKPEYFPRDHPRDVGDYRTTRSSEESIVVWDLDKNAWRTFRIDSLISAENLT